MLSVKGAPEEVLARCRPGAGRDRLEAAVGGIARSELRVLALATAATGDVDANGLDPLGLVDSTTRSGLPPSTQWRVAGGLASG